MTSAAALIAKAKEYVGQHLPPPNAFNLWYAEKTGNPVYKTAQWCAIFVSYVAAHSGNGPVIPAHAYTPSGVAHWRNVGRWHAGIAGIRAGDLVYFYSPSLGRVAHVGIATGPAASNGGVPTIEGNTSAVVGGDQRNGSCVAVKTRFAHKTATSSFYILGYGRPAYATPPAPAPKTTTTTTPSIGARMKQVNLTNANKVTVTGDAVLVLQSVLHGRGFYKGKIDSKGGPLTRAAVGAFQKARKLKVDFIVGPLTWNALLLGVS